MATCRPPRFSPWEETECFTYYDMLTPHEIYEVVGSHLTETDVEVLSFLLDEMYPDDEHPLDPEKFTQVARGDSGQLEVVTPPDPRLVKSWRRIRPRGAPCPEAARHKPKCGVELLLELERRGHLSEANLEPLLQLLRVLTRHDLLPFVSRKKRRTVSPERDYMVQLDETAKEGCSEDARSCSHANPPSDCHANHPPNDCSSQLWREGIDPVRSANPARRKRGKGRLWTRRKGPKPQELPPPPVPNKVTCDIRLRVRPEYSEQESVLRASVSSDKREPLARQLELFGRANAMLRARDLGSINCDIKFSEVSKLDAFWADYLSGALTEALKDVFLTDALRRAAGHHRLQLLVSVDQDDYEQGRRHLLEHLTDHHTELLA
ncbi:death effector domain-containing 1 [Clupea harengus]|uniref:Death effector domain-containing 1 n=1 Tax=Clupea harengus TaxID=7950 RepID=A0A6P3VMX4_CLUHA|nr:death effector domain-containing 1 [Clupea harengus]XP_031431541.1 death effector domain-containing 1 [Clupea harengus]